MPSKPSPAADAFHALIAAPGEGIPSITAIRRRAGMTLQDLARAACIDPAHLELMERGSHFASPTLAELQRIATALKVDVDTVR